MNMIIKTLAAVLIALTFTVSSYAKKYEDEWMPNSEFGELVAQLDKKSFWSNSFWVTEVDGRYKDGQIEYKFKYEPIPDEALYLGYEWYWWFGQDDVTFEERKKEYKKKGFKMVHEQSFILPDGEKLYQGVWHMQKD